MSLSDCSVKALNSRGRECSDEEGGDVGGKHVRAATAPTSAERPSMHPARMPAAYLRHHGTAPYICYNARGEIKDGAVSQRPQL